MVASYISRVNRSKRPFPVYTLHPSEHVDPRRSLVEFNDGRGRARTRRVQTCLIDALPCQPSLVRLQSLIITSLSTIITPAIVAGRWHGPRRGVSFFQFVETGLGANCRLLGPPSQRLPN